MFYISLKKYNIYVHIYINIQRSWGIEPDLLYSTFHKTLPRSNLEMHLISVRFYEMGDRTNVPKEVVFHHWARVKDTVEEGRKAGYISESDAQAMVPPDPKPGRFYGLAKNHVANYHFCTWERPSWTRLIFSLCFI